MILAKKIFLALMFCVGFGLAMGHWSLEWDGYVTMFGVFLILLAWILFYEWFFPINIKGFSDCKKQIKKEEDETSLPSEESR